MGGNARAEVTVMLGGVNEGMGVFAGTAGLGKACSCRACSGLHVGLAAVNAVQGQHTQSPASDCTHWRGGGRTSVTPAALLMGSCSRVASPLSTAHPERIELSGAGARSGSSVAPSQWGRLVRRSAVKSSSRCAQVRANPPIPGRDRGGFWFESIAGQTYL